MRSVGVALLVAGAACGSGSEPGGPVDAAQPGPWIGPDGGIQNPHDAGIGPDGFMPGPGPGGDGGGPMRMPTPVMVGTACSPNGSLVGSLFCADGRWRYALREDVPEGTYGGFTSRPEWFPALGRVFSLPASSSSCPGGKLRLTEAPLDPAEVPSIIPYGAMIRDHVTPIDHIYFEVSTLGLTPEARAAAAFIPLRAPADGVIIEASSLGSPTSMRVVIAHACETVSVFMVINKLTGPLAAYQDEVSRGGFKRLELAIKAGEAFGQQRDNPLDYSLHDGATWLSGFAHPFPYVSAESWKPYTVDPLPYWAAPISQQYEAKMQRTEVPRIGRIDWDKVGTASGNWFLDGTMGYSGHLVSSLRDATAPVPAGMVAGKNAYSWSHLTLAPHWVQPSVWLASLGTWNDPAGDFRQLAIRPGATSPDALTVASGVVVYELVQWSEAHPNGGPVGPMTKPVGYKVVLSPNVEGVLAVRVNAGNTITVEKRPDLKSAAAFTGFGPKAETYWR